MSDILHGDTEAVMPSTETQAKANDNIQPTKCCGDSTCGCDGTTSSSIRELLRLIDHSSIKNLAWTVSLGQFVPMMMTIFTIPTLRRVPIPASAMVSAVFPTPSSHRIYSAMAHISFLPASQLYDPEHATIEASPPSCILSLSAG